ncbi:type IV pilin protein [Limnohabitans sp.]|uniref:type IV pilin protein n=1 Tax=Limnohabitans sp. TaxID=1907725 RepID=UPI00286F64FD|nr:type IV pilin protein [Limnohabitans sp.]
MTSHTHRSRGFSLIELLITVACIAVLASMAWPSYQQHLLRSQRTQARASLLQAAHWLERAASANGSYPKLADVPASVLAIPSQRYVLQLTTTAQTYTLRAQPVGPQATDECGTLTLNQLGERGVLNAKQSSAICWSL